jgi:hypothetical protein
VNAPTFDSADVRAALARMNSDERGEWVSLLRRAAANLSNAEYAFAGNVPDAQPDPDTWAAGMLWLGVYQLAYALEPLMSTEG